MTHPRVRDYEYGLTHPHRPRIYKHPIHGTWNLDVGVTPITWYRSFTDAIRVGAQVTVYTTPTPMEVP